MANANKNKGKSFERELAHHLTTVFGHNFERVWSSGAFTGGKNVSRLQKLTSSQQLATVGDIIPPEVLSKFSWECKFYKAIPFHTFLTENAMLDKWIEQAKCPDRLWFLVFKINNQGAFVVFDANVSPGSPFVFGGNYIWYKGCFIVRMEGFFESNKDVMLNWNAEQTKPVDQIIKEHSKPNVQEWNSIKDLFPNGMPMDGSDQIIPHPADIIYDGNDPHKI